MLGKHTYIGAALLLALAAGCGRPAPKNDTEKTTDMPVENKDKTIHADALLDTVEKVYDLGGMDSVVNWVNQNLAEGTVLSLNQGGAGDKQVKLCDRAVYGLDATGNVTARTYLPKKQAGADCSLVRVLALTYVKEPFQVELYAKP